MFIARRASQIRPGVLSRRWFFLVAATRPPAPATESVDRRTVLRLVGAESASFRFSGGDFAESRIECCVVKRRYYSSGPEGDLVDVTLAQTGEGIAECELLNWFVKEGDEVDEFQPLCEVQSDKATIEITSRYKGQVAQTLSIPGDIVKVGETLLRMIVAEESRAGEQPGESIDSSQHKQNICGVLSTPVVRDLAKQYGVDINDVPGTGSDGRVTKDDITHYAIDKGIVVEDSSASSTVKAEHTDNAHDDKIVSLRGFQRKMVQSMSMAAKVPHFHYVEDINCNALVNLKHSFQSNYPEQGMKFTFLPVLIKSLSVAMTRFPWLNSRFNEDSLEVTLKGSHNIGVAMATQNGLVVPNIKNVQSLSIFEITEELSQLQKLASENKLGPGDISGGTITLSNIGSIGGKFGSPLLNLPEVSIIALGRIQKVSQFGDDGKIYPASIMTVNIGADHRVLDGATVARFCREWKKLIESPDMLLLHLR